eukprot:1481290-Rhodomonas_salina.2
MCRAIVGIVVLAPIVVVQHRSSQVSQEIIGARREIAKDSTSPIHHTLRQYRASSRRIAYQEELLRRVSPVAAYARSVPHIAQHHTLEGQYCSVGRA